MVDKMCPYALYLKKEYHLDIDCMICPSSVCNYPKVYNGFFGNDGEGEEEGEEE